MKKPALNPIAVVLLLLLAGFLLMGLLRGKSAVDARRAQLLENDFRNIARALHQYDSKFGALPGDDPAAGSAHLQRAVLCAPRADNKCAPGNGVIDGYWNATGTASESYLVWQHLRLAGLMEGATDPASSNYLPKNGEGGRIGITSERNSPIAGLHGAQIICSDHIKASLARTVDAALDDGTPRSGKVMVTAEGTTTGGEAIAASDLADGKHYLVCMGTGTAPAN